MASDYDVAIIGAGAAGIAAARRLVSAGRKAVLLEASDRIGGRAQTKVACGMPLDLGCGWLHSAERSPLVKLAEELGFEVDRTPSSWGEQFRDLGFPKADQQDAAAAFDAFDRRLRADPPSDRASDMLLRDCRWNGYLDALSGYINGASLDQLSICDYLAYDNAASEVNWRLPAGYGAMIAASADGLDVWLSTPVTAIDHQGVRVTVTTPAGTLTTGAAIVTTSTHVLAHGGIRFVPALDDWLEAASQLPLGLANKLFLALDDPEMVDQDAHLLGNPYLAESGSYYLRPFGLPVIECFFGGTGARELEANGDEATAEFAINQIAGLLGNGIKAKLRPIAASAWGRASGFGGSYSHALPGHADARVMLARPVDARLHFAGEACSATDFSTAHGAWASGVVAAERILNELSAA